MSTLNLFIYILRALLGGHGPEHGVDARAIAGGHLGVATALVHDLHASQAHGASWRHAGQDHLGPGRATTAHHDLHAGQANGARARLGARIQTSQVASVHTRANTPSLAPVDANLAGRLGADGRWHASTRVGQGAHGAAWALDVGSLGVVGHALVRLDDVLALRSHHNDTVLLVHELGGSLGDGGTTTGSHLSLVLLQYKKIRDFLSS